MSGFEIGDVVACIDFSPCRNPRVQGKTWPFPRGWVGKIVWVGSTTAGTVVFRFSDEPADLFPRMLGWNFCRFRKIQKADDAFTAQMRALKPVKQQA